MKNEKSLRKAKQLKAGDTIALFSPSSPLAGLVPHRVEKAKATLESMGFDVRIASHALSVTGFTAGSARDRATDLQQLFEDDGVHGIMSLIGGNHSNQILPYLDFASIARHPKVFIGYSDMTVLHLALLTKAGISTFYGPGGMTQFGEHPRILSYTEEYFKRATMDDAPVGIISPSSEWTDEVLDWGQKKDLERARGLQRNPGFKWVREGNAKGPLIGGCITSLLHLRGTEYWPAFDDAIFFWETPESSADFSKGCPPATVSAALADLALSGVFSKIKGMIVGRPFGYTQEQRNQLTEIIKEYAGEYDFPILMDVDFGHSDPMITIPIGARGRMDSHANTFEILEAGVL